MASDVTMPRLSDSMEEGTVLKWLVDEGGEVKRGEPLVEIETDKANMTYDADTDGVLVEIVAQEGDTLEIGEVIARIGDAGEAKSDGGGEAAGDEEVDEAGEDEAEAEGGEEAEARATRKAPRRPSPRRPRATRRPSGGRGRAEAAEGEEPSEAEAESDDDEACRGSRRGRGARGGGCRRGRRRRRRRDAGGCRDGDA